MGDKPPKPPLRMDGNGKQANTERSLTNASIMASGVLLCRTTSPTEKRGTFGDIANDQDKLFCDGTAIRNLHARISPVETVVKIVPQEAELF